MPEDDFYCHQVLNDAVPVDKLVETENVLAFRHTKPSYEFHVVVIPKQHIVTILEAGNDLIQELFNAVKQVIINTNLIDYRIVSNVGKNQDSKHLHFHLISGDKL